MSATISAREVGGKFGLAENIKLTLLIAELYRGVSVRSRPEGQLALPVTLLQLLLTLALADGWASDALLLQHSVSRMQVTENAGNDQLPLVSAFRWKC